ncbi:MAG: homocysteine S-methyltransferase [Gemmatimonadota bacterium]
MTKGALSRALDARGVLLLDGGFATALEANGIDLSSTLWSAPVILENPDAVVDVHADYLRAGADCITTASYQVTFEGFERAGRSRADAEEALRRATELALRARDAVAPHALVAASVGPFGASRADGSEYHGRYGVPVDEVRRLHEERLGILVESGPDVLACETIPDIDEAEVLLSLLAQLPDASAWMTFTCRDAEHISDGTPLREVVARCGDVDQVEAVGVNCVAPELAPAVVESIRAETDVPVIVYPNSGERWDPIDRVWRDYGWAAEAWLDHMRDTVTAGARIVGGCCRTDPHWIGRLRSEVLARD